jgi:ABC-type sugar transport system ATPase subunit
VLELRHVAKSFGHVVALRAVEMRVYSGEILALVGDNGAGKSTIVKILAGVYQPDDGEIRVRGTVVRRMNPRMAGLSGISTVFQDLGLVETLDVATNMYLGQPLTRFGIFAKRAAMYRGAAITLRDLQVRVPSVRIPVAELSGGQRQSVAVARAILVDHPIVLMDEPTAALGVRETRQVGKIIDNLKDMGKAVVIVSHDLEFVLEHADRVQAMRLGSVRGVRRRRDFNREEIVGLITGLVAGDDPSQARGDHLEVRS